MGFFRACWYRRSIDLPQRQPGERLLHHVDVAAPEGTPLVSPYDGTVFWRAVQDGGAGHYLIVRDAKGTDYVFMDSGTYDQLEIDPALVGDASNFLLEQQEAIVATNDGRVLYVELPASAADRAPPI